MNRIFMYCFISSIIISCSKKKPVYTSFEEYPTPVETNLWIDYSKEVTIFKIWSPVAEKIQLHLYKEGNGGVPLETKALKQEEKGIWTLQIDKDLHRTYYTYQTMINGKWLEETPGIYAKATGVNGKRAMVLDFETTNPEGWDQDKSITLTYPNEAIIYELHIRDMTVHPLSGSSKPGKYLGLVEEGTKSLDSLATGIDHLKELGITHVHLLPTYDHYSIDETKLDTPQFNW
ncbi:hypothetical protein [uncultured Aquimarina sp.]|nr:hypothetical protein [uncultured Aquimarina sp.]